MGSAVEQDSKNKKGKMYFIIFFYYKGNGPPQRTGKPQYQ